MNVVHPQISHTAAPCLSVITCKWLVWDEVSENLLMPHIIWLYVSLSNFLWRLDELHDVLKVATGRTKENGDPSVTCSDRGVKSSSSLSHYFFLPWLFFFFGFVCICIWNFTLKRIHSEPGLMVHGFHNPVTWEAEAGGKGVQGSPSLRGDFGSRAIQDLPLHSC